MRNGRSHPAALMTLGLLITTGACGGGTPSSPGSASSEPTSSSASASTSTTSTSSSTSSTSTSVPAGSRGTVAFQTAAGIRLADVDGSHERALTPTATGPQFHPDPSPTSAEVAFSADAADGTRDVWVASEGGEAERIYDCKDVCRWADDPAWSPDGRRIVVQVGSESTDRSGVGTLHVIDLATKKGTIVHTTAAGQYPFGPRWSGDGKSLVYALVQFETRAWDDENVTASWIETIAIGAGTPTAVTAKARRADSPDWNWSSGLIVFQAPKDPARPDGPGDLFTVTPDGMTARQVTAIGRDGGRAIQPSWSRDGSYVAYVAEKTPGSNWMITSIKADGAADTTVTPFPGTHPHVD